MLTSKGIVRRDSRSKLLEASTRTAKIDDTVMARMLENNNTVEVDLCDKYEILRRVMVNNQLISAVTGRVCFLCSDSSCERHRGWASVEGVYAGSYSYCWRQVPSQLTGIFIGVAALATDTKRSGGLNRLTICT